MTVLPLPLPPLPAGCQCRWEPRDTGRSVKLYRLFPLDRPCPIHPTPKDWQ